MPTTINDIVNVSVTLSSSGVSQRGFGTPLILATFPAVKNWSGLRVKTYSNLEDVLVDFTDSFADAVAGSNTTKTYSPEVVYMATQIFSQEIRPRQIKVGRRDVTSIQSHAAAVTAGSVAEGDTYAFYIDKKLFSYTVPVGGTLTKAAVHAALAALVEADADYGKLLTTVNDGTSITLAVDSSTYPTWADSTFYFRAVDGAYFDAAGNTGGVETITNAMTAIRAVDDDFYHIVIGRRGNTVDQLADISGGSGLAAWVESRNKIAWFCTDQYTTANNALSSVGTDMGNVLTTAEYNRSILFYSTKSTEYPECALMAIIAAQSPGAAILKFQRPVGITPESITSTHLTNLKAKNINFIEKVSGITMTTSDGKVVGGRYADVQIGIDVVTARIQESVLRLQTAGPKIPFTNDGIQLVVGAVRSPMLLLSTPNNPLLVKSSINVTAPDISEVPVADKQARLLDSVRATATLQGAIQSTNIAITLAE